MDGGTGKGTFVFCWVGGVAKGHNGVRDGGANVGSHDDENCLTDRHDTAPDQTDDNRSRRRRRLHHDGGEDPNHETWKGKRGERGGGESGENGENGPRGARRKSTEKQRDKEKHENAPKVTCARGTAAATTYLQLGGRRP